MRIKTSKLPKVWETMSLSLSPKRDQHLISPHYITPESNMNVMRMEEMITN